MKRTVADIGAKVAHVKAARQTRAHHCHWPDCPSMVPPARWGCAGHWFKLPKPIRDRIWKHYRVGQEVTQRPSSEYMEAARDADTWERDYIKKNAAQQKQGNLL
jgi:hypothetical protein